MSRLTLQKMLCASVFIMSSLMITPNVSAHGSPQLEHQMKHLSTALKQFEQAKNPNDAIIALNRLKQASNASKNILPRHLQHLPSTSPKVQAYRIYFNQMNAEIEQAIILTNAGRLNDAKKLISKINQIKQKGHATYH